jgi:hypothetical protein
LFLLRKKVLPFEGSGYRNKRNWKRTAEGSSAYPLITFKSLEVLISRLFFQVRRKVKGKWVNIDTLEDNRLTRIRIRVLMAIGPRSGLWYGDAKVSRWMFGSFYDGYWRRQFITAVKEWKFVKFSFNVLKWIKNSDESRIRVIEDFRKDLIDLRKLLVTYLMVPFTFTPYSGDRSSFAHVHPIFEVMYGYFAVSVPLLPIFLNQILIKFGSMVSRVYLLVRWYSLSKLKYYTIHGFRSELVIAVVLTWFSTWSIFLTVEAGLICSVIDWIVRTDTFGMWIRSEIWSTKGYAYWPAYDPGKSTVSTLEKVVDKVLLEDSGAYRQIIRMTGSCNQIRVYLRNKSKSESVNGNSKRGGVITPPVIKKDT